jgi:hypothetical protein
MGGGQSIEGCKRFGNRWSCCIDGCSVKGYYTTRLPTQCDSLQSTICKESFRFCYRWWNKRIQKNSRTKTSWWLYVFRILLLVQVNLNKCFYFTDTDTDFSESEALSSLQISGPAKSPPMQSEPEDGGKMSMIFFLIQLWNYTNFFNSFRTSSFEHRN